MEYLKKRKMYEILDLLVDANLDLMKNANYRFYRGSEWLNCSAFGEEHYTIYKLYRSGQFVSLDILQWNEEKDDYAETERITYRMIEGRLVKEYQRTEAFRKTEEIKQWAEMFEENQSSVLDKLKNNQKMVQSNDTTECKALQRNGVER